MNHWIWALLNISYVFLKSVDKKHDYIDLPIVQSGPCATLVEPLQKKNTNMHDSFMETTKLNLHFILVAY